jgi:thiamine-phosphate pyrophosphorylase
MYAPHTPVTYLITCGQTTAATTSDSKEFLHLLELIAAAVAAGIDLVQVREKALTTKVLYELVTSAARMTRNGATKLLVNDRADVAASAGADGVHLTTHSLPVSVVRQSFGNDFLIGVSTHSLAEAQSAQGASADFAVFGPVFQTPSKEQYGAPVGIEELKHVCSKLTPFPVLAIGGVTEKNFSVCLGGGAHGVAAIRMFGDAQRLDCVVEKIRED